MPISTQPTPDRPARALSARGTVIAALIAVLAAAPAAAKVPPLVVPPENPVTPEKAVLGKILFWEEQLSSDDTVACGTCHRPAAGGSDPRVDPLGVHPGPDGRSGTADDAQGSVGIIRSNASNEYEPSPLFGLRPQATRRRAPSVIGAAFFRELLWDGRASGEFIDPETGAVSIASGGALEAQSVDPPVGPVEMAHEDRTWSQVTGKLRRARPLALATGLTPDIATALAQDPTYPELFATAFGDDRITAERVAFALATYQRTLIPDQSPFDLDALTVNQAEGLRLFLGPGLCAVCHRAPMFTNFNFRNIGLRLSALDPGRREVTGLADDRGKFKVPSLRNVGLRDRFFHTGEMRTLEQVLDFYNMGGLVDDNLDRTIFPRGLSILERSQIIDFIANGLTDPRVRDEMPPFDRPALRSELSPPNPRVEGQGVAGSGGFEPMILARTPPGGIEFRLGIAGALGGATAFLVVSIPEADGSLPGHAGLAGAVIPHPPARSNLRLLHPGRYKIRLSGTGEGGGYGTIRFVVSESPGRAGAVLHARWIVFDPDAPGGLSMTPTAVLTLPN